MKTAKAHTAPKSKTGNHWTARSPKDFQHAVSFGFVTQIDKLIEARRISQKALAAKMGVSESRVSQVINSPGNLTLLQMIRFARAAGKKLSVVLYDDGDKLNNNGPVHSEIFERCWVRCGKPRDFFKLRRKPTKDSA